MIHTSAHDNIGIVIAAPDVSGHRLAYVRHLVALASELGRPCLIATTPWAPETSEWSAQIHPVEDHVKVLTQHDFSLSALQRLASETSSELVLPDGDRYVGEAVRLRSTTYVPTRILVMRSGGQRARIPGERWLRSVVKIALRVLARSRPGISVFVLSSAVGANGRHSLGDPVEFVRDESAIERVREIYEIREEMPWVAVLGAITERKNLPLIAEALRTIPRPCGLIIAGKVAGSGSTDVNAVVENLNRDGVEVRVVDRVLDETELDSFVVIADVIALAHSNEGPSGLLGKAAVAGTKVLCAGAASLRHDLKHLPGQGVWVSLDAQAISKGLTEVLAMPAPTRSSVTSPRQFAAQLLGFVS